MLIMFHPKIAANPESLRAAEFASTANKGATGIDRSYGGIRRTDSLNVLKSLAL